jgi:hypothetical protein
MKTTKLFVKIRLFVPDTVLPFIFLCVLGTLKLAANVNNKTIFEICLFVPDAVLPFILNLCVLGILKLAGIINTKAIIVIF